MRAVNIPSFQGCARSGGRWLVLLLAMTPALAHAHPGHAESGLWAGLLHPFHGIDHVLAALAIGVWATRVRGRALWALPLAFVAAMTAGIGAALAGLHVPSVEPVIAASVLLLGALIALDARLPTVAGAALAVAIAPFHAAAHVAEMPVAGNAIAYVCGVLLATALSHGAGITVALRLRRRMLWLRLAAAPIALCGAWMVLARVS